MNIFCGIKPFFLASALICATSFSHAQPVQESTLNKLLELSKTAELIQQSNQEMKPVFDSQAQDILKANLGVTQLNTAQTKAADKISLLLQQTNTSLVSNPKFLQLIKNNYRQIFTEQEAQAYIDFLSTPVGQQINQKSSKLMSNIVRETTQLTSEMMNDPERQEKFRKQLMQIIEPLILN